MKFKFTVTSTEETMRFGEKIGAQCASGDIICLIGDLATGKTHLTKGIAKGLNITEHITSPTFTIVNEYDGRLKLYHFDVYRVNDPDEIEAIGFDEYIFSEGISIIEWANYIEELIPKEEALYITISKPFLHKDNNNTIQNCDNLNIREIEMEYTNNKYDYIKEM